MSRQPSHTVFVGNIPYDVTETELTEIFSEVGQIKSMRMVSDKDTGKPKGYAFCEYYDRGTAESAVRNLNQHEVSGRTLRVDYAEDHTSSGRPNEQRGGDREREGPGAKDRGRFDRDGPRGPYGPPAGLRPVGAGSAASAAQTMANMLGSPQMSGGAAQETLNHVLGGMNPVQMFEVMSQMKALVQQNPAAARQVLVSQPHLTRALFQAQILLGMVKPAQQPQQPPQQQQQQQQPQAQPRPQQQQQQQQPAGPPGPIVQQPPMQQQQLQQPQLQFPPNQGQGQQGYLAPQQVPAPLLPAQPQVVVLGPGGAQVLLDPSAAGGMQLGNLIQQPLPMPSPQTIQMQLPPQPQIVMQPQLMPQQVVMPMHQPQPQPQQQQQMQMQPQQPQQQQQQQQAGTSGLSQGQQQALLNQLLRLTPEQLEALPPVEKAQAQAIINMIKNQQHQG